MPCYLGRYGGRDAGYLAVNKAFTMNIIVAGTFIRLFPEFMKPCVVCKSRPVL